MFRIWVPTCYFWFKLHMLVPCSVHFIRRHWVLHGLFFFCDVPSHPPFPGADAWSKKQAANKRPAPPTNERPWAKLGVDITRRYHDMGCQLDVYSQNPQSEWCWLGTIYQGFHADIFVHSFVHFPNLGSLLANIPLVQQEALRIWWGIRMLQYDKFNIKMWRIQKSLLRFTKPFGYVRLILLWTVMQYALCSCLLYVCLGQEGVWRRP